MPVPNAKVEKTLWKDVDDSAILLDTGGLESLFCAARAKEKEQPEQQVAPATKKQQEVSLVDANSKSITNTVVVVLG